MDKQKQRSPLKVLCLSLLVFLISDTLIFRSGLYTHYLNPHGTGYSTDFIHALQKMHKYESKNGVLLIGSSEFRWPIDKKLLKTNAPVKINKIMPNNTNEESWYYLLKLGDPNKNRYKLVVVGLPHYTITPEDNILANLDTAQGLAFSLNWEDYLEVVGNYPDLSTKFQALNFKLFPSILYAREIVSQIFSGIWKMSPTDKTARYQKFLDDHRGLWRDVILDKQNNLIECRAPQDLQTCKQIQRYKVPLLDKIANSHTQQNFIFEKIWVQKIINYYQGTNTKLIFIELPHAPGVTTGSPIVGAPDIRNSVHLNPNTRFLPEGEFQEFSSVNFMHDPYHLSPTAVNPAFTQKVLQIISSNLPLSNNLSNTN